MRSVDQSRLEGDTEDFFSGSALTIAAAQELSSPLVLLRQLGLAVSAGSVDEEERMLLGKRLTLTSERALRIAHSLSLAGSAQQALHLEPVNPVSICQEVIHELTPLFAAHGQSIMLHPRSRVPLLVANRSILQHILASFGDNALYYGSKTHPIEMTISAHKNKVRLGVRDYGPAVPINMWDEIEGKIRKRAIAPISTRPTISTVGLIAAKKLAEAMDSAVGTVRHRDGVTFYVDLRVSNQMSIL